MGLALLIHPTLKPLPVDYNPASDAEGGKAGLLHQLISRGPGDVISLSCISVFMSICCVHTYIDLRKGSPTYKQWVTVELSAENKRMFFIPRGFGHGFVTLTDDVEFCYKVDNLYSKECDRGIRYNDPFIGVDWGEVNPSLLSQKDTTSPLLDDSDCNFVYDEI